MEEWSAYSMSRMEKTTCSSVCTLCKKFLIKKTGYNDNMWQIKVLSLKGKFVTARIPSQDKFRLVE